MRGLGLIDTNVLIYQIDPADPRKQGIANRLIASIPSADLIIPMQSVQEFCFVAQRKFGFSAPSLKVAVDQLLSHQTALVTPSAMKRAIRVQPQYQLQWWDSLLIASCAEAGCTVLYTEDMQNGQTIEGVTIVNPFI